MNVCFLQVCVAQYIPCDAMCENWLTFSCSLALDRIYSSKHDRAQNKASLCKADISLIMFQLFQNYGCDSLIYGLFNQLARITIFKVSSLGHTTFSLMRLSTL